MDDGRKVDAVFIDRGDSTEVIQTFDPEGMYPVEYQQAGWQAIMDSFKRYTETN